MRRLMNISVYLNNYIANMSRVFTSKFLLPRNLRADLEHHQHHHHHPHRLAFDTATHGARLAPCTPSSPHPRMHGRGIESIAVCNNIPRECCNATSDAMEVIGRG